MGIDDSCGVRNANRMLPSSLHDRNGENLVKEYREGQALEGAMDARLENPTRFD